MKKNTEIKLKKLIERLIREETKQPLQEYFAREGDSITEIGQLNIFSDMEEGQLLSEYEEEFGASNEWLAIEKKYIPIAAKLWKVVERNQRIKLTEDEIYDLEHVWYDGSDAYGDVDEAISYLPRVYDEQIEAVTNLLRNRRVKV